MGQAVSLSRYPSTTLYAFSVRLRPEQRGTLMPFNGDLVQGALLKWIGAAAPEVAAWLHEGQKRRLFTCSSLQFPFSPARMREAELRNTYLPLEPGKTYSIRFTLLHGELFPLLYRALMDYHLANVFTSHKAPFLRIGKQAFWLEEVLFGADDPSGWTGYTTFRDLVQQARQVKRPDTLTLEFASLTTSNRGPYPPGSGPASRGKDYFARLPLPLYVFSGLAKRWEEVAPPDMQDLIQQERIQHYLQDEGIFIQDYELKTHHITFTTHTQPGYIGTCTYFLRSDGPADADSLTIQQQLHLLADLAFYCGIGYKTAMGMGQARKI
jgi:CRISPR-associated endoribonuclease Cas6